MLSIAGGKWTTYRKMAEDVIDQAILIGNLDTNPSVTESLQIYGYHEHAEIFGALEPYGSATPSLRKMLDEKPHYKAILHPKYSHVEGEVIWAVRNEMARNIEDFLARRTRLLFLDVVASLAIAPKVAHLMATELGYNEEWEAKEIQKFTTLAQVYMPNI